MSEILVDPQTDPRATYAVDPARVRHLLRPVVAAPTAVTETTSSPMDGAPLAALPLSTRHDVEIAVAGARAAQRAWASRSIPSRAAILLRFHDLVLTRQAELLDLIQLESGKARRHAFEEVADVALVARHYARASAAYLKDRRPSGVFPVLTQVVESRHPKGVVGIVSPWNYPLSLSITDTLPALMAGNAVVLRPDLQASLSTLAGVDLLREAGLPDGVLQIVLGHGPEAGQAVVDLTDYVCFTGSTATGRRIARSAAERLVGFSLELGGKNALYVADDAPVGRAVEGAVRGCFSSAGQLCISAERVLVHDSIYDDFVPKFVAAVKNMRLGTTLDWGIDMGSLVGPDQLATVTRHVRDAVAKGATVLAGGRPRPDLGPYVHEPTLLAGVTAAMECRDGETFGPVVAIYRVSDDDAAVALANDTEYGLNASVWTRDLERGRRVAARIHAGTVNINEAYAAAWASTGATMGGMKASGVGRRHGAEGILKYTEAQNVTAQRLVGFGGLPGMSDRTFATGLTMSMRLLRRLGAR